MRLPRLIEDAADWVRYDLPRKLDRLPRRPNRRLVLGAAGVVAVAALIWAVVAGPFSGDDEPEVQTRVVTVAVESDEPAEAPVGPLGFPLVATRNTTRVGGADPAVDAAAAALATHPSAADPVEAAVLVGADDPYAGIAAAVLAGPPLRAPILIGNEDGLPDVTADALAKLDPRGGSGPADAALYRVGNVAAPAGLQTEAVEGDSAAEIADALDRLRGRLLSAKPRHILIASSEQAPYAMPAAAWAARSGDPVLFSGRNSVPDATLEAVRRHRAVPVYVLGPDSVISQAAVRRIQRVAGRVQRIGAEGPVANSIAFARYIDSTFGWNINDPGHGLVLASASRPLDAAAAASLSASGKWGPLLVIDRPAALPGELRSFLLDIKPGFEDDPTRAVYNHVWLIGDSSAIGARVQAEIDELAEVAEVGPGAGGPVEEGGSSAAGPGVSDSEPGIPLPGGPEPEPPPKPPGKTDNP